MRSGGHTGVDELGRIGQCRGVIDFNELTWLLLASLLGLYGLRVVKNVLTLRNLSEEVPEEFKQVFDDEKYAKAQAYQREGIRLSLLGASMRLLGFVLFWLLGGFTWFDGWVRSLEWGTLPSGLLFIGGVSAAGYLFGLPLQIYDTFSIEERYGFNRSTVATFVADQFKAGMLFIVLGLPILALVLWIFSEVPMAWLWAWGVITVISLSLSYLAPTLIMPLFNKFEPMPEGELKVAIEKMAKKCEFPLTEVSVVDGSRRSSKANAFFTGFGKRKRIALFDTLIAKHEIDELVGVLAHEIGHFKCKHLIQRMAVGVVQSAALFFVLGLFVQPGTTATDALCAAFGVPEASVYAGLMFFLTLFQPVDSVLGVAANAWSRKHEFEADAFAARAQGTAEPMMRALKKLSADNLSNLTPPRLAVILDYSHPPVLERLAALRKLELS